MARSNSPRHVISLAICGVLFAAGAWFVFEMDAGPAARSGDRTSAPAGDADDARASPETAHPAPDRSPLPQTDFRFPESGRLGIDSSALTPGRQVTFGLALSDEELGGEALAARVVAMQGRAIDAVAVPFEGNETGAGLALDTDWLKPGIYLIEIRTKEKVALPLRRFVLEVR